VAITLIAVGSAIVLAAGSGLVLFASRPAIEVAHADPHQRVRAAHAGPAPGGPSAAPRPTQPRTGLWIQIPALLVSLPIRDGDGGQNVPQWEALHYPGTPAPGAPGSSYLYAHGLWGMFGDLLYARTGDVVELHDYSTGRLQVLHVSRVVGRIRWNDVSWIHRRASRPTLVLQTCVDDNPYGDRFVVEAS